MDNQTNGDTDFSQWKSHKWVQPQKLIKEAADLDKFKHSESFKEYLDFIQALQASVESKPASATPDTPKLAPYIQLLDRLITLVDEVPPIQQQMRFGNTAFKDWHNKAMQVGDDDKYR